RMPERTLEARQVEARAPDPEPLVVAPASPEDCRRPEFRRAWEALLAAGDNLYAQYQSPDWYDYLRDAGREELLPPVAARDGAGRLVGLAPLTVAWYDLRFNVREFPLGRFRLRTVSVLGSLPLLPRDAGLHDRLFAAAADSVPGCDAVYLHCVPTG